MFEESVHPVVQGPMMFEKANTNTNYIYAFFVEKHEIYGKHWIIVMIAKFS
jgi:hypothetical protein